MADGTTPLMKGEETLPTAPPPAYSDIVAPPSMPQPQQQYGGQPQQQYVGTQPQNQYGGQYTQPGSNVYYGAIPQGPSTVVLSSPPTCSAFPVHMQCTNCGQPIVTQVTYVTGMTTWLACLAIFVFGGFLGCCFIPFCVDSLKDARHSCPRPSCRAHLGTSRKL